MQFVWTGDEHFAVKWGRGELNMTYSTSVVAADIRYVNNIHRITSSLAICLQSKSIFFVYAAMVNIELKRRAFILKGWKLGSEDCVDRLSDLWNSNMLYMKK